MDQLAQLLLWQQQPACHRLQRLVCLSTISVIIIHWLYFPLNANTSSPQIDSNPPASQPATTPTPQKVEPTTPESSSRAPAIPTPSEPQLQPPADTEAIKNTNPSITIPTSADTRAPTSAVGNNGMSATSGPLDDQIVHEYSDIGKEDAGAPVSKEETAIAGKEEITAAKPVNVDAVKT